MANNHKKSSGEDFLPPEKKEKNSCSLFSVLLILTIIFIVALLTVIFLRFKLDLQNKFKIDDLTRKNLKETSLSDKIDDSLNNQKGENVEIEILESDLDESIGKLTNFPIKKPKAKIASDKIILSGKTGSTPFSLSVEVGIAPKVVSGKISYEIKDIKATGVPAPKKLADSLTSQLSSSFDSLIPGLDSLEIDEVKLFNGYLKIFAKRK